MKIAPSDCDTLISHCQLTQRYCLIGGVLVVALGVALILSGQSLSASSLIDLGGGALTSTSLVPFRLYFKSAQGEGLATSVKRQLLAGEKISEVTDQLFRKTIAGTI